MSDSATRQGDITSNAIRAPGSAREVARRLDAFLAEERLNPQGSFEGDIADGWIIVKLKDGNFLTPHFRGQIIEHSDQSKCTVELHATPSLGVALLFGGLLILCVLAMSFVWMLAANMLEDSSPYPVMRLMTFVFIALAFLLLYPYLKATRRYRKLLVQKLLSSGLAESRRSARNESSKEGDK